MNKPTPFEDWTYSQDLTKQVVYCAFNKGDKVTKCLAAAWKYSNDIATKLTLVCTFRKYFEPYYDEYFKRQWQEEGRVAIK